MILAEDVYTYSNQLILPKGYVLTDKAITSLEFYAILNVKITDGPLPNLPPQEEVPSFSERVQASEEFHNFKDHFDDNLDSFQSTINDIVGKHGKLNTKDLLEDTLSLLHTTSSSVSVFDMLHNMRQYDDLTYAHSMNVALICNSFAKWLKFSEEDVNKATLCGLLHDIGKTLIPDYIIKKPDKLTDVEYEIIKTHPVGGYNILKSYDIDESIMNAALMHHERCDGSGYPSGFMNGEIDEFAKIVAIADVYDAMTSARVYRGPMCPFKVVQLFEYSGLQLFDPRYILTFLEYVVGIYLQNRVILNNGMEGEVIFINKDALSRPVIKSGSNYIDLAINPELEIIKII